MLQIVPTHWYSWDFNVSDEFRSVATGAVSWWREQGALTIDGATYRVHREAPLSGAFILDGPRGELARAEKPSSLRREFVIHHANREYTLRPTSMFRRAFVLWDGVREVGSIAPKGAFTREAAADLPPDLPVPVRMFIVWLTMISWRRDAASG